MRIKKTIAGILLVFILMPGILMCFYVDNKSAEVQDEWLGGRFEDRVNTGLPVVRIKADYDQLFGYESGILVPGRLYDKFIEGGCILTPELKPYAGEFFEPIKEGEIPPPSFKVPANFNRIDVRCPMSFSVTEPDSTLRFTATGNLSIGGNSSRSFAVKPLKLRLDNGKGITYKLRNTGIDIYKTQLRNALVSELAIEAGFSDCPLAEQVSVYINDRYYGMMDLIQDYSQESLANTYGLDYRKIEIVTGLEENVLVAAGFEDLDCYDFSNPADIELFEEAYDVEQLLYYYAFELIMENTDWPLNNYKAWRYTGEYDPENKYTDGRFRMLLFDMDASFEGYEDHIDPFENLLYATHGYNDTGAVTSEHVQLLGRILENDEYETIFVNDLMELTSYPANETEMLRILDENDQEVAAEIEYASENSAYEEMRMAALTHGDEVQKLKDVITRRQGEVYSYIYQYFGGEEVYSVMLCADESGSELIMGHSTSVNGEEITRNMCSQFPVRVHCEIEKGYEFDHYLVNGTPVYDRELELLEGDGYTDTGAVRVELVTRAK